MSNRISTHLYWVLLSLCVVVTGCGRTPPGSTSDAQPQAESPQPASQPPVADEGPSDEELRSTLGEAALNNLKFNGASIPREAVEVDRVEITQKDTVSHGDGNHYLVKAKVVVVITKRTGDIAKAISNSNANGLEKAMAVQNLFRGTLSRGVVLNPGDEYLYLVNADLRKGNDGYEIVDGTVELASTERIGTKNVASEEPAAISPSGQPMNARMPAQATPQPEILPQVEKDAPKPDADPTIISRTAPRYPPSSIRYHHEGTVTLDIQISADGNVSNASVHQSSGFRELDISALQSVRFWHLTPKISNGHAVESTIRVPITFSLSGSVQPQNARPMLIQSAAAQQAPYASVSATEDQTGQPEASFDCAKAATPTELAICSDPALRKLDGSVGEDYRRALQMSSGEQVVALKISQRRWIIERQQDCEGDKRCIAGYLRSRISELRSPQ